MDRHSELEELGRLISDPRIRLLTLTGLAGVGKSRLAAAVLEAAAHRGHLTAAVDIAEHTDRRTAWLTVSATCYRVMHARVGAVPERAILLLDNCDRLASEIIGDISAALSRYPDLLIVVTSRRALDLYQECLVKVRPLACASGTATGLSSAARLVLDSIDTRCGGVAARVDRATLEAIVSAVGGVPMALELVATTIGRIGAGRTLERITAGLPLMPSPFVDIPQRHRTIRECVEWGLSDLDDYTYELLLHIGMSEVLTHFEELILLCGERKDTATQAISELVARSLVDQGVADDGHYTYAISGFTRTYCRELLNADPLCRARIRRGRARAMCVLGIDIGRQLEQPERRPAALTLVDRWLADLLATVRFLIEDGDAARAVRLLSALEDVWICRGMLTEAEAIVLSIPDRADADMSARCWELAGRWAFRSARFQDAVQLLARAAEHDPPAGEPAYRSRVARQLGEAYRETGDHLRARAQLDRALLGHPGPEGREAAEFARELVDIGGSPLRSDHAWSSVRDRAASLANRRDRLTVLNALGRMLLRAEAPHRALEVFHLVLRVPDPEANLLEMVGALEGCVCAYRAVGAEYPEQIQRFSAAVRWLRDTYALPRPTGTAPRLVDAGAEDVAEQDGPPGAAIGSLRDVDEAIAYALATPLLSTADIDTPVSRLTKRQLEVAHLVAEGMTNRMIATRLGIAEWTVINHLRQVMIKLDCPSRLHVALVMERESQQSA
ncbi:LuxR C-terminal-related transcriptional regulator [Nocardia wallacei]|uniref:LuxR C-terminal-related transcriptional regulator n=1 Tax=Nocardia wallacei TaxID=480035 RepID=UPI002453B68F|nr:LuxR C-terminal-related transcriptional regulator [Nocardia wallacei]